MAMLSEELLKKLKEHAEYFPRKEQAILLCLHEVQDHYGHKPTFAYARLGSSKPCPYIKNTQVGSLYMYLDYTFACKLSKACFSFFQNI